MKKISELNFAQQSDLSATAGLEFEIHRVVPQLQAMIGKNPETNQKRQELVRQYQDQLNEAKEAKIINDLNINGYFESDAEKHEFLAKIQKNGKDFLGIAFDDNNEMGRLEYISIGIDSGILPLNKFLEKQNLADIKGAIILSGSIIKKYAELSKNSDYPDMSFQLSGSRLFKSKDSGILEDSSFNIVLSDAGKNIFKNPIQTDELKGQGPGVIHVSHTAPKNIFDDETLHEDFISNTAGQALRQSLNYLPVNHSLDTKNRTRYSPNPKTPLEFLVPPKNPSKITAAEKYAELYKGGEVLYPMSNIVQYIGNTEDDPKKDTDMARYNAVIAKIRNHGSYATEPLLKKAESKIELTKSELAAVVKAAEERRTLAEVPKIITEEAKVPEKKEEGSKGGTLVNLNVTTNKTLKPISIRKAKEDSNNLLLFSSIEEKTQKMMPNGILMEQRNKEQNLVKFCRDYLISGVYSHDRYEDIVKSFTKFENISRVKKYLDKTEPEREATEAAAEKYYLERYETQVKELYDPEKSKLTSQEKINLESKGEEYLKRITAPSNELESPQAQLQHINTQDIIYAITHQKLNDQNLISTKTQPPSKFLGR